jgi:LemA protein
MLFKMDVKPNFSVESEKAISVPPTVDFSKPAPVSPPTPAPAPAPPPAPAPAQK